LYATRRLDFCPDLVNSKIKQLEHYGSPCLHKDLNLFNCLIGTFPDKNGALEHSKEDSRNQKGHNGGVDDKSSRKKNSLVYFKIYTSSIKLNLMEAYTWKK
jgi:hypothetical protein